MFNRQDDLMPSNMNPAGWEVVDPAAEQRVAKPLAAGDAIPPAIEAKMLAVTNGPENESYAIQSDDDFHRMADKLVQIKDAITAWGNYWDPLREGAHQQWKKICARIKEGRDPLELRQQKIIDAMGRWDVIREQRRKAEQERKNAELKKQMEDRQLEQAAALVDQGKTDLADAVIDQPVPFAPAIEPKEDKPLGLTPVRPWTFEYTDKLALARAALDPKSGVPFEVIQFDEKMLKRMAVALKDGFQWPGVKAVQEVNFARNRR